MAYARKLTPRVTPVPTDLVTSPNVDGVHLAWALHDPPNDFTRFEVYRDGAFLANSATTSYDDDTATAGVTYDYQVLTVRTNTISSVVYRSALHAVVEGSWTDTEAAEIEIVSVTSATTGVTVLCNPVTDADHYRLLRSLDPLTDFATPPGWSDSATTTLVDNTGTAGTLYFYKVQPVDTGVAGTASRSRVGSKLGATGGDAISLASLTLAATIEVIHIDLAVTGDIDSSARGWAEFGIDNGDGTTTWRHCITPLMRRLPGNFIGAAVELDPDTTYTIRAFVTDTGGVATAPFLSSSATTRADETSTHASIKALTTHYVEFDGGDDTRSAATATNSATPWKTINRAISQANSGAITNATVQVLAGYNPSPATQLTASNFNLVAENSATLTATADNHAPYNDATPHSIVYGRFTAPTDSDITLDAADSGSAATTVYGILGKGGWTAYNPTGHAEWAVWRRDVGAADISQVGFVDATEYGSYAEAKAAEPMSVLDQQYDGSDTRLLHTHDGWAEFIYTNLTYNSGFWQDSATLYIRLPDDIDPNDCYIWMTRYTFSNTNVRAVVDIAGTNVKVAGFNARQLSNGFRCRSTAADVVLLRNYTRNCGCPYAPFKALNGIGSVRITVQDWRSEGSGSWVEDMSGFPWEAIKQFYAMAYVDYTSIPEVVPGKPNTPDHGVTFYGKNRMSSYQEISAFKFNQGGAQWVIRRGEVKGIFNGIGSTGANTSIGAQRDIDIYDIRFEEVADNCIEPEGAATGWVGWNHEMKNCRSYMSTDSDGGAHIFYRVQGWQWGTHGIAPVVAGLTDLPEYAEFRGGNGQFVKFGANPNPDPHYWLLNFTAWTDKSGSRVYGKGIGSTSTETFHNRNNIFRGADDAIDNQSTLTTWDNDWNLWGGGEPIIKNVSYSSTDVTGDGSIAAARDAEVMGDNDNHYDGDDYNLVAGGVALIDSLLTDTATGDLSLNTTVDGHPWPNISDGGGTPDRGYEG